MSKDEWLTSRTIADILARHRRDNDIKVMVDGCLVPIVGVAYDSFADMIIITLDEDGDEYKMALNVPDR